MKIFDVLARLKNVKGPDASGNYLACCPAHDDKRQSLSVKQGERGVIMKCYAGCGVREICAKIGIRMEDLFDDKPKPQASAPQQRRLVKVYPYTDKDGKLLFEVCRYEPKSFNQRMPDPAHPGQWIWRSCPIQPLYRLPEVNKAIAAGQYVCVAEGEKDADTLARLGYCGTTIAMGAGKWKTQHTEQLQGARVSVDGAGQAQNHNRGQRRRHADGGRHADRRADGHRGGHRAGQRDTGGVLGRDAAKLQDERAFPDAEAGGERHQLERRHGYERQDHAALGDAVTIRCATQALICALIALAAIVAYRVRRRKSTWGWILAYWIVLTIKNLLDLAG